MRFGIDRLGESQLASAPSYHSVPSPFRALLNDPEVDRVFLLDAYPYDPALPGVVEVRFSSGGDWPIYGGNLWPARLVDIINLSNDLFSGGNSDLLGGLGSVPSFGTLTIAIGDGDNDTLTRYNWDGRAVSVLMGAPGYTLADFGTVLAATAQGATWDENILTLSMRDFSAKLDRPIAANVYAGTGGLEGGQDIAGAPKPLSFGSPKNVPLVLVDAANDVYQCHDGAITGVDAVYDKAVALTAYGDMADVYTWLPIAGQYATDVAHGIIRLGAKPTGTITADINANPVYRTASDLVLHIASAYAGLGSPNLDLTSFSDVNAANNATLSAYINDGSTTIADMFQQIMGSIGGFWTYTFTGLLTIGVLAFTTSSKTLYSQDVESISRTEPPLPIWRRKLGYARSWFVQSENDMASGVDSGRRSFIVAQYRYATSADTTIQTRRLLAVDSTLNTLLDTQAAAQAEAARHLTLLGSDRSMYSVAVARHQYMIKLGDTITLSIPRFNLPKDFIVLGVTEDSTNNVTSLRLWG